MKQPPHPLDLLVVAAGGAAGALLRWALGFGVPDAGALPIATLLVNVVGAFCLGALPALAVVRRSHRAAIALGPGLLGGFTTVSAWAGETRELMDDGRVGLAFVYVVLTVGVGLAAAAAGRRLSHQPEPEDAVT